MQTEYAGKTASTTTTLLRYPSDIRFASSQAIPGTHRPSISSPTIAITNSWVGLTQFENNFIAKHRLFMYRGQLGSYRPLELQCSRHPSWIQSCIVYWREHHHARFKNVECEWRLFLTTRVYLDLSLCRYTKPNVEENQMIKFNAFTLFVHDRVVTLNFAEHQMLFCLFLYMR